MKKRNGKHQFTPDEAFAVTAGALRYALGRHTYSTSLVWGLIRDHWCDPEVVRQRECIKRDIEAYVDRAQLEHEGAVAARPVLEKIAKMLETACEGCRVSSARSALRAVADAVARARLEVGAVPKYPDLDTEHTWLPALEWMREHMDDPVEWEQPINGKETENER